VHGVQLEGARLHIVSTMHCVRVKEACKRQSHAQSNKQSSCKLLSIGCAHYNANLQSSARARTKQALPGK